MTTLQINQLKELNAAGYNDTQIAAILGVSRETVTRYRKKLGLPSVPDQYPHNQAYYKVYDTKTNRLLAEGYSQDIVEQLGFASLDSFYNIALMVRKGQNHKYRIVKEPVKRI